MAVSAFLKPAPAFVQPEEIRLSRHGKRIDQAVGHRHVCPDGVRAAAKMTTDDRLHRCCPGIGSVHISSALPSCPMIRHHAGAPVSIRFGETVDTDFPAKRLKDTGRFFTPEMQMLFLRAVPRVYSFFIGSSGSWRDRSMTVSTWHEKIKLLNHTPHRYRETCRQAGICHCF